MSLLEAAAGAQTLGELVHEVAVQRGDATALVDGARCWSYRQLDGQSDALAEALRGKGVGCGDFVGVLADRRPEVVIAIIGILKAGAAYVPLDPFYPRARLELIAADTRLRWVIGPPAETAALGLDVAVLDPSGLDPAGLDRVAGAGGPGVLAGDEPAYVIHTSGSTGRPNGCVVSHANVLSLLRATLPLFEVGPQDRWTLFHSASFDFSVWELWAALATGACAVNVPAEAAREPAEFLRLLSDHQVSVLNQVPSVFGYLVRACADAGRSPAALRYVIFGGEAVRLPDLARLHELPGGRPAFVNMYGITETTVHVSFKLLDASALAGASRSPIGTPLPHLRIELFDDDGRPVPAGEVGEVWVSGGGVCAGYLDRPELTRRRFVNSGGRRHYRSGDLARQLPDGEFEYVGRADHQVKLRGFRIELGEVEAAVAGHPRVRSAAATVTTGPTGAVFLVVLVVPTDATDSGLVKQLRAFVAAKLPPHMVPDRFRLCEELPLTASGKTDRSALVELAGR